VEKCRKLFPYQAGDIVYINLIDNVRTYLGIFRLLRQDTSSKILRMYPNFDSCIAYLYLWEVEPIEPSENWNGHTSTHVYGDGCFTHLPIQLKVWGE